MKNMRTTIILCACIGLTHNVQADDANYAQNLGIQTYTAQPESSGVVTPIGANQTSATQNLDAYRNSIDPKIHYVNEEISVIRAFNKNKNEILEDVNWLTVEPKNLHKYACIYEDSTPKMAFLEFEEALPLYPYLVESAFRPIRFVKISHKKNCQDFYVYMQQKINGQWVYKYNKYPLGIYKSNKAEFVTYLTHNNIANVLKEEQARGKLTTRTDGKEPVFVEFLESKDKKQMEMAYQQNFTLIQDDEYALETQPMQATKLTSKPLNNLVTNTLERVLKKRGSATSTSGPTAMQQPMLQQNQSRAGYKQDINEPQARINELLVYDQQGDISVRSDLPAKEELTDMQIEELLSQIEAYKNYLTY